MLKRTTVTKKGYQDKRHSSFNPDGSILAEQWVKRAANMCTFPGAILRHLQFCDSELFPLCCPCSPASAQILWGQRAHELTPAAEMSPDPFSVSPGSCLKAHRAKEWRFFRACSGGCKLERENEAPLVWSVIHRDPQWLNQKLDLQRLSW